MAKSIIQLRTGKYDRECFLCREQADRIGYMGALPNTGLHKHHFVYGRFGAFREKAERYGLWAYCCMAKHHEYGPEAPHVNHEVDLHLKQIAQRAFEEKYSRDLWMQEFGKNYIEDEYV